MRGEKIVRRSDDEGPKDQPGSAVPTSGGRAPPARGARHRRHGAPAAGLMSITANQALTRCGRESPRGRFFLLGASLTCSAQSMFGPSASSRAPLGRDGGGLERPAARRPAAALCRDRDHRARGRARRRGASLRVGDAFERDWGRNTLAGVRADSRRSPRRARASRGLSLDAPAHHGHRQRHARQLLRRRPARICAGRGRSCACGLPRRVPTSSTSAGNRRAPAPATCRSTRSSPASSR